MTQSTSNNVCPNCGSNDLYLIGAVLRGKLGVKYEGSVKDALAAIEPQIYEGLVVCKNCKHQINTHALSANNDLGPADCMWENTALGTKIPIVCSECGNKKAFTKVVLEQRMRAITYALDDTGVFKPQDQGLVMGDIEQLVIQYTCDSDNCTGMIILNDPAKYTLQRD